MDERLHDAFLAELEALEQFRVGYSGMYPQAPLAREDPDVRRLLEALAMFTARTRVASERNVEGALLRIVRQHFPYLLSPVPALFMLRGTVSRSYVDVSVLPRGSQVNLVQRGEAGAPDAIFSFQTLTRLRLLPITLEGVETFAKKKQGLRLALRFSAAFPRNDQIDEIELHIDYLDDLHSSLLVLHALQAHLVASSVRWDHDVHESSTGEPCRIEFGPRAPEVAELGPFDHPLQQVRAALHFPQSALFMRIRGLDAARGWQRFTVLLDLDDDFPANLQLNVDCFQLHVVPAMNIRLDTADPLSHDGTVVRQRARHSDPSAGFVPLSIHAVYRKTPAGLVPLEPAIIRGARDSFEAEIEGRNEARSAFVTLHLPDAFEHPETAVVEALWHQPAVSKLRSQDCRVKLKDRFIQGIDWDCLGQLMPHTDSELDADRRGMLELLSIRGHRLLGLAELQFLLHAMGISAERSFAKLTARIADLKVVRKPAASRSRGFKHVYHLEFSELMPSDLPKLHLLCSQLLTLLTTWAQDEVIELVSTIPNLKKELRYS